MKQIPVMLKYSGRYHDDNGQLNAWRTWLTVRGISFTFMLEDVYDDIPCVVMMSSEDAIAFRLRFGL